MKHWLQNILQEYGLLIGLAAGTSLLVLIISIITVPLILVRMRPDYFVREHRRRSALVNRMPFLLPFVMFTRNILGGLLIVAGILMLLTPGQGLITIFVGLMIMDFPGKYRFERWLVSCRFIYRSINWLRQKAGCPPIILPERAHKNRKNT